MISFRVNRNVLRKFLNNKFATYPIKGDIKLDRYDSSDDNSNPLGIILFELYLRDSKKNIVERITITYIDTEPYTICNFDWYTDPNYRNKTILTAKEKYADEHSRTQESFTQKFLGYISQERTDGDLYKMFLMSRFYWFFKDLIDKDKFG
jgi:hypothetical protein